MKNTPPPCQDALNADSLHQAAFVDENGHEQTITRDMIEQAIDQLADDNAKPKS